MKKRFSYRDKLIDLAQIYNVREVQEYIKRKKNLTTGQLELILKKNKIVIPKDLNISFYKENFVKPLSKLRLNFDSFIRNKARESRKKLINIKKFIVESRETFFEVIKKNISNFWKFLGKVGLGFLNTIPKLSQAVYIFTINLLTDLFNGIYNQKVNANRANQAIVGFFVVIAIVAVVISGITSFNNPENIKDNKIVKKQNEVLKSKLKKKIEKPEIKNKKIVKKPEIKNKKIVKKPEIKNKNVVKKPEIKNKAKIAEAILPDLNLKTETVLNLFKDVNYDLNKVRYEKKVKPIYFTQFPKDLDEIQSIKLKKETFIKIVLPLIVAENEKILDDRYKLKKIVSKKSTTDGEKQWLRQKFLEYKVKKANVDQLITRMDMIPVSIALAQAAKESGWGTSRFALEGNAIYGQWTWSGKGIAPLMRDKSKNHKILKFPILRASVKAYKKNLNTHKSYKKFRDKRRELRKKNQKVSGLKLTETLENYAETGSEYTKILEQIITQNKLMDFEPVKLTSSTKNRALDL